MENDDRDVGEGVKDWIGDATRRTLSTEGSLENVLGAVSCGSHEAFRTLYEATSPKLFALVLRMTRSRLMAEDVLQEAYVKIWQNAGLYSPAAGKPMAWLSTISRNCAIDRIRSEKVARSLIADTDFDDILHLIAAPETGDFVLQETLRFCLLKLPVEDRICVVLAYDSPFR